MPVTVAPLCARAVSADARALCHRGAVVGERRAITAASRQPPSRRPTAAGIVRHHAQPCKVLSHCCAHCVGVRLDTV